MDYSNHSQVQEYFVLVRKFDSLSQVLVEKLHQLETKGFHPDNLFMYGFSFGAQLVVNAGNLYGERRIAEIDGKYKSEEIKVEVITSHQDRTKTRASNIDEIELIR